MKRYNIKTGLIISMFVALLAFIPRMLQDSEPAAVFILNLAVIFIFSITCWVINQRLVQTERFGTGYGGQFLKIFLSFIFSIALSFVLLYVFRKQFGSHFFFSLGQVKGRRAIVRMMLVRGSFVNAFLYFLSYILFLSARSQQALLENERLKHENLEARLFILKQQLSPHFLFNSLGILNTLTTDANIHRYIVQLSNIYRYLLNNNSSHLAGLAREMEFIDSYLYILKERFEDALQVDIIIDGASLNKQLPPASLQLLIENAIKHNVVSADEPLHLKIYTQDGYVAVSNNLNPKFSSADSNGIGLHNISERYKLLSKETIIIEKNSDNFTVKLPLIA